MTQQGDPHWPLGSPMTCGIMLSNYMAGSWLGEEKGWHYLGTGWTSTGNSIVYHFAFIFCCIFLFLFNSSYLRSWVLSLFFFFWLFHSLHLEEWAESCAVLSSCLTAVILSELSPFRMYVFFLVEKITSVTNCPKYFSGLLYLVWYLLFGLFGC